MKTIGAKLFTLFILVVQTGCSPSEPLHLSNLYNAWKFYTFDLDERGTIYKGIGTIYRNNAKKSIVPIDMGIVLFVSCPSSLTPIVDSLKTRDNFPLISIIFAPRESETVDILGNEYNRSEPTSLSVKFYNRGHSLSLRGHKTSLIHVVQYGKYSMGIVPDNFGRQFRLNLENYNMLEMEIDIPEIWTNHSYGYIIVRFDITGFLERYDSHCG